MPAIVHLQQIIGVDKKNPFFTLCRNYRDPGKVYVFFGAALMEVVDEDRSSPEFKLLIARLYNAGMKVKSLVETFNIPRTTMQRWGDALKKGDPEYLIRVLSGSKYPRKLTTEVLSFAEIRFMDIYKRNRYSYSTEVRKEIKEVFHKDISGEALRPYFKKWKAAYWRCIGETSKDKRHESKADENKNACKTASEDHSELEETESPTTCSEKPSGQEDTYDRASKEISYPSASVGASLMCREHADVNEDVKSAVNQQSTTNNRKQELFNISGAYLFCHHVGVLLFSVLIARVNEFVKNDYAKIVKQWISTILLGAVNIEQTKILDFDALEVFFGEVLRNPGKQRSQLEKMALMGQNSKILELNAFLIQASSCSDFYFDPHTKHYTGLIKIFKGWCSRIRFADKIMNIDFLHTIDGHPVYMAHDDNFHDLRERFFEVTAAFRAFLCFSEEKPLTFIVDRGIYDLEVFQKIMKEEACTYFITWEKGYKRDLWDESSVSGNFNLFKPRNSANDLQGYSFQYIDRRWRRDNNIRQIIVRATNPRHKTIEVSIISNHLTRDAQQLIEPMFKRWIQENDFKYLDTHFGVNEITSYAVIHYRNLEKIIRDKEVKSGLYKALEVKKRKLSKQLGTLLLHKHRSKKMNSKRNQKIEELTSELKKVEVQMENTQKEESRLKTAVKEDSYKLNMLQKSMMDSVKILARNMFYVMLQPFKELYNNYRDDHVLFRNLTRSHGCICLKEDFVDVVLFPTAHYQPKLRKIVETILEQINAANPPMSDNSGRIIRFSLGKKEKNLFAILQ